MKNLPHLSSSGWNNLIVHTPEETQRIAKEWADQLPTHALILLEGTLGAGKTTFVKGLAQSLGDIPIHAVQSPTFTYLHLHKGKRTTLYHFDLYRLSGVDEFVQQGFDEFLELPGLCCIEWPERITPLLQRPHWKVSLSHIDATARRMEINYYG